MRIMVRLRLVKCMAWLTASALLIPYAATGAAAAQKVTPAAQTVIVFPLDNSAGTASAQIADELTSVVRGGLATQAAYRVVGYSERLPAVAKMVRLDPEKSQSISGPFYSDRKSIGNAVALGKAMSADLVVVGVLEKYSVSDKGVCELGATVELVDVNTGKTVRTVVVTGHSGTAIAGAKPSIDAEAVADTGQKIVSGIVGTDYEVAKNPAAQPKIEGKKSSNKSWVTVLLIAVGIALLAGHHSGGDSSSNGDNPPAPPF